jgi:hypothetical protein
MIEAQYLFVRNRISLTEVLAEIDRPDGRCEVCASADGTYEESSERLIVKLDCQIRPLSMTEQPTKTSADWLPRPETVTASVSRSEASDMTKEIFGTWTAFVRKAILAGARR